LTWWLFEAWDGPFQNQKLLHQVSQSAPSDFSLKQIQMYLRPPPPFPHPPKLWVPAFSFPFCWQDRSLKLRRSIFKLKLVFKFFCEHNHAWHASTILEKTLSSIKFSNFANK
jgi:hypothetical protein